MAQVRDLQGRLARRDPRALHHGLGGDDAADGRAQGEGLLHLARLLQLVQGLGGDVPQLQASPGRVQQVAAGLLQGAAAQGLLGALGQQELPLGAHELGAVEAEEGLALGHGLAYEVSVELLHEALDLHVDLADAGLVRRQTDHRTHLAAGGTSHHLGRTQADELLAGGVDGDGSQALHAGGAALDVLDGHQVHGTDGTGAEVVLEDLQVHGALVHLLLRRRGCCGGGGAA